MTKPATAPNVVEAGWSEAETAAARSQCAKVLARFKIEATPLPPIKDGECGDPAPMLVSAIGAMPAVHLKGPATLNCDMIATLAEWFERDVQPAAKRLLGEPVQAIEVMSSYSCRNAYGRRKTKLSEHGRANALDVGGFDTGDGNRVAVLDHWGITEREIKARIAAAKAAAKKHAAEAAAEAARKQAEAAKAGPAARAAAPSNGLAAAPRDPAAANGLADAGDPQRPALLRGFVTETMRGIMPGAGGGNALSLQPPSRLGGPKAKTSTETPTVHSSSRDDAKRRFLHEIHASACKRFGTVLGPEANAAHKNHFHIDRAERARSNYCE